MLWAHRSNRLEHLLEGLIEVIQPFDPLAAPTIAVQGRGMERWLALRLAAHFGVWLDGDFPFPEALLARVLPQVDTEPGPSLDLRIAARLLRRDIDALAVTQPLQRYLQQGEDRSLQVVSLAESLGELFQRYARYRPDWLQHFEAGTLPVELTGHTHAPWQAWLWRELCAELPSTHLLRRLVHFDGSVAEGETPLFLFGFASLPPRYLHVLQAAAQQRDVHLFNLGPSPHYLGDVQPERQVLPQIQALVEAGETDPQTLALLLDPKMPPLLAECGQLGRHLQVLLETESHYGQVDTTFNRPEDTQLLGALQAALYDAELPEQPTHQADASLQIHACAGSLREVEAVHAALAEALQADPSLTPEDCLVLVPDLERYAGALAAVFNLSGGEDPERLPGALADRLPDRIDPVARYVLRLLETLRGRCRPEAFCDLLSLAALKPEFALSASEAEQLLAALEEAGAGESLSGGEGSLRWALDRLLLGWLAPETQLQRQADIFARDSVLSAVDPGEGEAPTWLAKASNGLDVLCELVDQAQPRPLTPWLQWLQAHLDARCSPGKARERMLALLAEPAPEEGDYSLEAFAAWLDLRLKAEVALSGLLRGGVTLCEPVPMRSIPFRVVAFVGLSDGAFPRPDLPASFDLSAAHPRIGDRSLRAEGQHVFLEALLSARDRLLLTYTAQDPGTGQPRKPSTLLQQLLRTLEALVPDTAPITRQQALHPSSAPQDARLCITTRASHAGLAAASRGPQSAPPPSRPEAAARDTQLSLRELQRAIVQPWRNYLARQLGASSSPYVATLDLEAVALGKRRVARQLRQAHQSRETPLRDARGEGWLPPGTLGRVHGARMCAESEALLAALSETGLSPENSRTVEDAIELWPDAEGWAQVTLWPDRPSDRLFFNHFVGWLGCCAEGHATQSVLAHLDARSGAPKLQPFAPVHEAIELLETLRTRLLAPEPLLLFPTESLSFARHAEDLDAAWLKAASAWDTRRKREREGGYIDDDLALVFGTRPWFDDFLALRQSSEGERFAETALRFAGPLITAMEAADD